MNVYIEQVAERLAAGGTEVEIFTRATSSHDAPVVEMAPGVLVRHVQAGPYEGLGKEDLASQLCAFTSGVLRVEAQQPAGTYDLVHSHYWLSGQVGWLAKDRWGVPLVHSAHTLAKVKNAMLAEGDRPEPHARVVGEEQVVYEADRLVANTPDEAHQLVTRYGADPARVATVAPGVDLDRYRPGDQAAARAEFGLAKNAVVLLFVGRVQPLKAPDVLLRAAAAMLAADPGLRNRLAVVVCGGPSGSGLDEPEQLQKLAATLGITDVTHFLKPLPPDRLVALFRAADITVVPSHNESFGLVAMESQASGTPVVAANVGGLATSVADGVSGLLVDGHDPYVWGRVLAELAGQPRRLAGLSRGAVRHASGFAWERTAEQLRDVYLDAVAEHAAYLVRTA